MCCEVVTLPIKSGACACDDNVTRILTETEVMLREVLARSAVKRVLKSSTGIISILMAYRQYLMLLMH